MFETGFAKSLKRVWEGCRQGLERICKNFGTSSDRVRNGSGNNGMEMVWKGFGKGLDRVCKGSGTDSEQFRKQLFENKFGKGVR